MRYERLAGTAAAMISRFGGPVRLKRELSGDYDPVSDALVLPQAVLPAAVSSTAVTLGLLGEADELARFPRQGLVLLGSELIYYSRREDGGEHPALAGLERGAEGSLPASHATAASLSVTHACAEAQAVSLGVHRELVARQLAQPGDRRLYLSAVGLWFTPRPGDTARLSGREFRLEEVDSLSPDNGTSIYYEALGRSLDSPDKEAS